VDRAPKAGEFNETGALRQSASGLGSDYNSVFYVKMFASEVTPPVLGQAGQRQALVVAGDPADAAADNVVLMPENRNSPDPTAQIPVQATDDQVFFRPTAFPILAIGEGEFTNIVNPRDVDNDGEVAASDVLAVINNINATGSRSLVGLTPNANAAMVDVNMDSQVTSMDVLVIINFINSFSAMHRSALLTTQGATGSSTTTDPSLTSDSPSGVQSSGSTTTTTPTLLTNGTSSSTTSSSTTSSSTTTTPTSSTSTNSSSTSTSSSTVDPAAADQVYSSLQSSILKRFGR
jgi:hypothetical protein